MNLPAPTEQPPEDKHGITNEQEFWEVGICPFLLSPLGFFPQAQLSKYTQKGSGQGLLSFKFTSSTWLEVSCDAGTRKLVRKYKGEVKRREVPRKARAGISWMMAAGVWWPWNGGTLVLEGQCCQG